MGETEERIKSAARDLGFSSVGITRAASLDSERQRLETWLARGLHATMDWMARDTRRRTDPEQLFAGARSIISVAINYNTTQSRQDDDATRGKISRYAWGDDYHDVMGDRLKEFLDKILAVVPDARGKICVDTAPMMDKAWAVRAGLGWIGKHSNLITTEIGSWVFLGEIILDVDLEPDPPFVGDHCGNCTRCIDACPTSAIVEPFVVDSHRCISFTTIELRDQNIADEIASSLDGWIYGCDVCQEVCPWNRFEEISPEERFQPRNGEMSVDLDAVLDMDHQTYVDRFRKSAIKRAKLTGLKRNALALIEARSKPGAVN